MRRILITGGAGFIGSHLVEKLAKKHEVIVIDNFYSGKEDNLKEYDVEIVKGSINDNKILKKVFSKKIDYIYHLASQISVVYSLKNPIFDARTNILGTINLLKHAKNVKKLIYFSSAAVYGHPVYLPINENHPLNPKSNYGISKMSAEFYCRNFGVPFVILRLFNVYGIGQTNEYAGVISKFVKNAKKCKALTIFGDGEQYRDFIHVKDVIEVADRIREEEGIFNVGTSRKTTINELARIVKEISKKEIKIVHKGEVKGEIRESVADIKRLKKTINWRPKIELKDGIEELMKN